MVSAPVLKIRLCGTLRRVAACAPQLGCYMAGMVAAKCWR